MSTISDDRWTCPTCGRTVIVYASPGDTAAALSACQKRHSLAHRRLGRKRISGP